MEKLINSDGSIRFGVFDDPVEKINAMDYRLLTWSGRKVPDMLKKWLYKGFHFMGITTPDIMAGVAVVNLGYLASAFAYVYHRDEGWLEETSKISLFGAGSEIVPYPEDPDSRFKSDSLDVRLTRRSITVKQADLEFAVKPSEPDLVPPLRVCTRTGYRGWTFTRKASPLKVSGKIEARGQSFVLDPGNSFAITDWTGGFLRRETFWNWAAISTCLADGRTVGLNLSWGVNETGFTENAFWIDSKMTKVDMVSFSIDDSEKCWRITSFDRRVEIEFVPDGSRGENLNLFLIATKFVQCFGRFSGRLITHDDEVVELKAVPGWTEDHFARW